MQRNYMNSVCFTRTGSNVREAINSLYSLQQQVKLNNEYGVPGTYLLQYDCLTNPVYVDFLKKNTKPEDEIGIWFEIVRPLAEDADCEWRGGDVVWNHYVDPDFLMAYNREEKAKIIDKFMRRFHDIFGYFPKTVGSWLIDSESMEIMSRYFYIDAYILCREQWGMDGYTLWGGPYYGGYYPCKNNALCPAETPGEQLPTPVFRMFVNDPIYCYYEYAGAKYNGIDWGCFTQEPCYAYGYTGARPAWVKWMFDAMFDKNNAGFNYIQLGQENYFDWLDCTDAAFIMQQNYARDNREKYGYEFVTVGEMGRRFKEAYSTTPRKTLGALTDWFGLGNQSYWACTKHYRLNLFADANEIWIRDFRLFDEKYRDRYLDNPCRTASAIYDTLPLADGIRFSSDDVKSGFFFGKGRILSYERGDDCETAVFTAEGKEITLRLYDDRAEMTADGDFSFRFVHAKPEAITASPKENAFLYDFEGYTYRLSFPSGKVGSDGTVTSENGKIEFSFAGSAARKER